MFKIGDVVRILTPEEYAAKTGKDVPVECPARYLQNSLFVITRISDVLHVNDNGFGDETLYYVRFYNAGDAENAPLYNGERLKPENYLWEEAGFELIDINNTTDISEDEFKCVLLGA